MAGYRRVLVSAALTLLICSYVNAKADDSDDGVTIEVSLWPIFSNNKILFIFYNKYY